MNYELLFSAVGMFAMTGWLVLLASPWIPKWSDRIAGLIMPVVLAAIYVAIIVLVPAQNGGFESFSAVLELFMQPQAVLAGWIHFLAFDLIVGAWICRNARAEKIPFWCVLPCLPLAFLFGPAGFLAYSIVRMFKAALVRATVA